MSFFSRARRRLLRRPPKSPPTIESSDISATPEPCSPSILQSPQSGSTAPTSSDQSQDPDREAEEEQLAEEGSGSGSQDNGGEDAEDEDQDESGSSSHSSSDGEDATPTTPSNPPATSDTDVDIAASGTPPANPLFTPPLTTLTAKSRAWLSPDPAALKPQLFLDLSKMTPFASPSGKPFGGTTSAPSQQGVYTFGADADVRETNFKPTGLKLSYGCKYTNPMITLKIGADEIPFHIHKSILTDSCPIFDKMLNGPFRDGTQDAIKLDEDDPDAFGIIIEWLYTGKMAMFNPVWINKSIQMSHPGGRSGDDSMIHVPLPSYFGTPTASHELAPNGYTGPYQAMYQHICTQNLYASLSPEEIRLVEHFPSNKDVVLDYVGFLQGRGSKESEERSTSKDNVQFMLTADQKPGTENKGQQMLNYLETVEQIPVPVPFPTYIDAEYLQLVLIKVLITADKYCWEDLFNDAMDAFRVGELHLGRRHPVVRHIELAYSFCPRKSPLVTLMADMAFYAGKAYQSQGALVEVGSQYPEFLEDLMARYDKQISIPGYDPVKDALKLFRGPLSKAGGTYHYHPTKDSLAGACTPRCVKRHRERGLSQT